MHIKTQSSYHQIDAEGDKKFSEGYDCIDWTRSKKPVSDLAGFKLEDGGCKYCYFGHGEHGYCSRNFKMDQECYALRMKMHYV